MQEPPLAKMLGAFFTIIFKWGVSAGKSSTRIKPETKTTKDRASLAINLVRSKVLRSILLCYARKILRI